MDWSKEPLYYAHCIWRKWNTEKSGLNCTQQLSPENGNTHWMLSLQNEEEPISPVWRRLTLQMSSSSRRPTTRPAEQTIQPTGDDTCVSIQRLHKGPIPLRPGGLNRVFSKMRRSGLRGGFPVFASPAFPVLLPLPSSQSLQTKKKPYKMQPEVVIFLLFHVI